MAGRIDTWILEQKVGIDAAHKFENELQQNIALRENLTPMGQTQLFTHVNDRYRRNKSLLKIVLKTPSYQFKLNYGFEGIKKNGIKMRMPANNVIADAIIQSNIIADVADKISSLRADDLAASVNFR